MNAQPTLNLSPKLIWAIQVAEQETRDAHPKHVEGLNGRFDRGITYAKTGLVQATSDPDLYEVKSAGSNLCYDVSVSKKTCNCKDAEKGYICKHRVAVWHFRRAGELLDTLPWAESDEDEVEFLCDAQGLIHAPLHIYC